MRRGGLKLEAGRPRQIRMRPKNISIVGLGDLMLRRPILSGKRAGKGTVREVRSFLQTADMAFANLEMVLCQKGCPREKMITLRGLPRMAREISALGIQAVSLANNHVLDFGFEGLFQTLKALRREGIGHVGAGKDLAEAVRPLIQKVGETRIGFLAYASTLPLGSAAEKDRPGVAPVHVETYYWIEPARLQEQPGTPPRVKTSPRPEDLKRVGKELAALRPQVDLLFVSFHWGVAFQDEIAEYQRHVSHFLVDQGADVVLGHHAHRIQEVEIYKGKPIFYSLGDFGFQYEGLLAEKMSPESIAARFVIAEKRIREIELIPALLDPEGDPRIASGEDRKAILRRIRTLSPSIAPWMAAEGEDIRLHPGQ